MISAKNSIKKTACALIVVLGFAAASAQAQKSSGNIIGDAAKGDTVVVVGEGTGFHRDVAIDRDGRYNLRSIPPGDYVVTVKRADGSEAQPKKISVRAGATARVQ